MASPAHTAAAALHRHKTTGHSTHSSISIDDQDLSDMESDMPSSSVTDKLIVKIPDDEHETEMSQIHTGNDQIVDDFSFTKPVQALSKRTASFKT